MPSAPVKLSVAMPHVWVLRSALSPTRTPAWTRPVSSSTARAIEPMPPCSYGFHPSDGSLPADMFTEAGSRVVVLVFTSSMGPSSTTMYARSRALSIAMSCTMYLSVSFQ